MSSPEGGNNGADALYAGAYLAARGASVEIVRASDSVSTPKPWQPPRKAGCALVWGSGKDGILKAARRAGLWIDGLAGIQVRPPLTEPLSSLVTLLEEERIAAPDEPIVIAVDCPTGIGVDDGALSARC